MSDVLSENTWTKKRISDIANVSSSSRVHLSEYVEDGVPFFRSKEVILRSKNRPLDDVLYISKERFSYLKNAYGAPLKNDILVTAVGTIGRVYLVEDIEFYFKDGNLLWLNQISEKVMPVFLSIYLSSEIGQTSIDRITGGSSQAALTIEKLKELEVFFPSISQQQKIAKVLTTVDNLIEKTQSLIDKYTAIKQGMMADLFSRGIDLSGTPDTNPNHGQLRPSYELAPELYKQTELGWVPEEWNVSTIKEVSVDGFKNGYFKDPKLVGDGMKLVNVTELYQDFGIDITPAKVERILVSAKDYEKYKAEIGDIFFTRSSLVLEGIAKSNIIRTLPEQAVFECHVMRLKPNKKLVIPEFLAIYSGMPRARVYLMSMAKQVTMTTIAQPDMVGLPVPVPTLEEQKLIVDRLDKLGRLIENETLELNKNRQVKKGLMQDLLTGKVQVTPNN
jgi:type I restriction enzyme S subunit